MRNTKSMFRILAILSISAGMVLLRNDDLRMQMTRMLLKARSLSDIRINGVARASSGREAYRPKDGKAIMGLDCDSIILGINAQGEIVSKLTQENAKGVILVKGCRGDRCMIDGAIPFPEIGIALSIVESLSKCPYIAQKVRMIDVADPRNPKIGIADSLIVDVGLGDHTLKLRRLAQVVAYSESLSLDLRRVDLRFGNQVIVEARELKQKDGEKEKQKRASAEAKPGKMRGG